MSRARDYRRVVQGELREYEKLLKRVDLLKSRPNPEPERIKRAENRARAKAAEIEKQYGRR